MLIEEVKKEEVEIWEDHDQLNSESVVVSDAKRVLVGAGARALFYPTLLYNVVRNKIQSEFRWWDKIDEVWFTFNMIYLYEFLLCFLTVLLQLRFGILLGLLMMMNYYGQFAILLSTVFLDCLLP